MSDDFGDAVYETWRRGGNPDRVDADRMSCDAAMGWDYDERVSREVGRCLRGSYYDESDDDEGDNELDGME